LLKQESRLVGSLKSDDCSLKTGKEERNEERNVLALHQILGWRRFFALFVDQ